MKYRSSDVENAIDSFGAGGRQMASALDKACELILPNKDRHQIILLMTNGFAQDREEAI
jgi:Mg-chelatase subunit ChlD